MENNKKCPNCGQSGNIDRNLFCHSCNTQLRLDSETGGYAPALLKCPECGQLNNPSVTFCSKCGCSIKETSIVTVVPAEKKKFNKLYASFVAVGIALLLGIGVTFTYFNLQPAQSGNPKIDVVFCIDTTGSMGDEIDVIKEELKNMIGNIQNGNPRPYVRVGVVAYKDRGDVYVVQPYELTGDIQSAESVISSLSASGGSDHEESVNEALHTAVQGMNWDMTQGVTRMIFLIADAGPHMDYENDYNYKKEIEVAKSKNIMISTVGCSGLDSTADVIFKEIACATNGTPDYLTYRQAFVNEKGDEKVILYQGGRSYVVNDKYKSDTSWKDRGAINFASEEKAKTVSAPSASYSAGDTVTGECEGYSRKSSEKLENNLDRSITQQVQTQAKKQGVKY